MIHYKRTRLNSARSGNKVCNIGNNQYAVEIWVWSELIAIANLFLVIRKFKAKKVPRLSLSKVSFGSSSYNQFLYPVLNVDLCENTFRLL